MFGTKFHVLFMSILVSFIATSCIFDSPDESYREATDADLANAALVHLDLSKVTKWKWTTHYNSMAANLEGEPITGCESALDRLRYAISRQVCKNGKCQRELVLVGTIEGVTCDSNGYAEVRIPRINGDHVSAFLWLDDSSCPLYDFDAVNERINFNMEHYKTVSERTEAYYGSLWTDKSGEWEESVRMKNPFACVIVPGNASKPSLTVDVVTSLNWRIADYKSQPVGETHRMVFASDTTGQNPSFRNLVFCPEDPVPSSELYCVFRHATTLPIERGEILSLKHVW